MPSDLDGPTLLVGTRKGAWLLACDRERTAWAMAGPMFLGHVVQHLVLDPRDGTTLLMAAKTGHLGPTVFRSSDLGRVVAVARPLQHRGPVQAVADGDAADAQRRGEDPSHVVHHASSAAAPDQPRGSGAGPSRT